MDCDYAVCAGTEQEVLEMAADHARTIHNMKGFSKEDYDKARAAIRDGYCEEDVCSTEACCC
jgi:predicted small metal-binding protein